MSNSFKTLFLVFLLSSGQYVGANWLSAQSNNQLSQDEIRDGWRLLFDGESLNGWRGFQQSDIADWEVQDGNLVALGQGSDPDGDIITEEEFDNFELYIEWKISPNGNSGIFFHVSEDSIYKTVYETGPEYQLIDDLRSGNKSLGMNGTAGNYSMHAPDNPPLKKAGEWNTTRIIVDHGKVKHWLNGKKVVEYELLSDEWEKLLKAGKWKNYPGYGTQKRGHIALQDHGNKIWFRNIKIKPLGVKSLFNGKNLDGWEIYGSEKWYVENGLLICESGPDKAYGYLATKDKYKNFELTVEFLQASDGNSGVFFRSEIEGTRISGWQVEVAPHGRDTGGIYESYGRGWLQKIPDEKEDILKMGEWNHMKIVVVDDHVQTFLNGVKMADLTDEKIGQANGKIALQIHDGGGIKVKWRNLLISESIF